MSSYPVSVRQNDQPPSYEEISGQIMPAIPNASIPTSNRVVPVDELEENSTPLTYIPLENFQVTGQQDSQPSTRPQTVHIIQPKRTTVKKPRTGAGGCVVIMIIIIIIIVVTNVTD